MTVKKYKPWLPAEYTKLDVSSIQAIARGDATPDQQKHALSYIINEVAKTYEMSFQPGGIDGQRESEFAEGKRYVGNQLVKLTKLKLGLIKD